MLYNESNISKKINIINQDYDITSFQYKNKLVSYGIYCKEEEQENWIRSCNSLMSTRENLSDEEWEYERKVFELTAQILKEVCEYRSWDDILFLLGNKINNLDLIRDISEMVLVYSPRGIEFIDNVSRKKYLLKQLERVKPLYDNLKSMENNKNKILLKK